VDKSSSSLKDACLSAVILALANMGDAFLYAYLPANYQQIGISSFWVGVILSVNRFTRLFLNGRVAWFLSSKGVKTVVVGSVLLASLTTVAYGWMNAIPLWVLARVLWGISFSTLRLGNTLYALEHPRKGLALGLSRALIELGPVFALFAGPFLLHHAGRGFTFSAFGLISISGILLVLPLSNLKTARVTKKELALSYPSSFNVLVLINAFITEGVLVVLAGKLIQQEQTLNLANELAIVGLLLGYRRLSFVVFSPLSGWLGDQWGFHKVFIYTNLFSVAASLLVLSGATVAGILAAFTFSAMNASAATGGAIISGNSSFIKEASDNATWRDVGTATGAFTGALLLSVADLRVVIAGLVIIYAMGLLYHRARHERKE